VTEPLSSARFRELADAYGGTIARWPAAERAAASRIACEPWAAALLAEATWIDAALDTWRVSPDSALAARIAETLPEHRPLAAIRLWWSGLAIGAVLAGTAAGAAAAAIVAPPPVPATIDQSTAFGDLDGGDWL
jgi:hypothetical protein